MRILPQNPLLFRRRGLSALALIGVWLVCGSCAKFPPNAGAGFTQITFTFSVAGQINYTAPFVYDVAITASPEVEPPTATAPLPVINSNNPNGRVAGSPNFFIEYTNPGGALPYTLNRFALASEVPNPNDPTNPINLAVWAPSTRGVISTFTDPSIQGNDPSTISFTVYTNELADTDTAAKALQSLQVNILTMTKVANQGSNANRVIDALGNSSTVSGLNQFLVIDLRSARTYNNAAGFEPTGDTYGGTEPDVDIVNYTITVTPP